MYILFTINLCTKSWYTHSDFYRKHRKIKKSFTRTNVKYILSEILLIKFTFMIQDKTNEVGRASETLY